MSSSVTFTSLSGIEVNGIEATTALLLDETPSNASFADKGFDTIARPTRDWYLSLSRPERRFFSTKPQYLYRFW